MLSTRLRGNEATWLSTRLRSLRGLLATRLAFSEGLLLRGSLQEAHSPNLLPRYEAPSLQTLLSTGSSRAYAHEPTPRSLHAGSYARSLFAGVHGKEPVPWSRRPGSKKTPGVKSTGVGWGGRTILNILRHTTSFVRSFLHF